MTSPQETTTIEDFIESGKNISIDYTNLSFIDKMSNGTCVSVLNVINDYMTELKNACVTVELTQEQQWAYFYKPKMLCYDIYGNPELYFVILLLNDMADVKEFTKPKIKMLRKDHMSILMGYIFNSETSAIDQYNDK
jgi:hypothetical protein